MRFDSDYPTYIMLDKASIEAKIFKNLVQQFPGQSITKFPQQLMTESVPIEFKATDGKTIKGYITYTPTEKQSAMPMVVLVHGGPQGRDYREYNSELQLLASQGYRGLQINYRGSLGYGRNFLTAGDRHWGDNIQQDIIDGTRWAIKNKFAIKDKICIMGTSFGGYSAVQRAILAPDLYQCAVSNAGIYDLTKLYDEGDIAQYYTGKAFLERVIGKDHNQLRAFSPAYNAEKLAATVFIAHGRKNQRAPVEHAEVLIKA